MDPYENLAIAIVQSAVSEYIARVRLAAKKGYVDENCNVREECAGYVDPIEIRKLIRFFKSDYCYVISGVDGDLIIEKANRQIKSSPNFKPIRYVDNRLKKGSSKKKAIIAINAETGEEKEFESLSECARHFDVSQASVSFVARYGKVSIKGGLVGWKLRYKEDVEV